MHPTPQQLSLQIIRSNMDLFDLKDLDVTIESTGSPYYGFRDISLSHAVSHRPNTLAKALDIEPNARYPLFYTVSLGGKEVGSLTCDGIFRYHAAPTLYDALAWAYVSDLGQTKLLRKSLPSDAKLYAEELMVIVEKANPNALRHVFFDKFMHELKERFFRYPEHSRFSDGYCGAVTALWRTAMSCAGKPHEGFSFLY